ncbi:MULTISPECIES: sensor histidine kinase [unclassified Streptomyces]|uniref:sensor histidine kinase n=1 Tax=unclassified Streptomyces TaxID=2593676 RepID=UPI0038106A8F
MPQLARPRQRPSGKGARSPRVLFAVILLAAAVGAGAVTAAAPDGARTWVLGAAAGSWVCLLAVSALASSLVGRARRTADASAGEMQTAAKGRMEQSVETARLVNVTLPEIAKRAQDGLSAEALLAGTGLPVDPHLRRLLEVFTTEFAAAAQRTLVVQDELERLRGDRGKITAELEHLSNETLPAAVALLREGGSADTVLAAFTWPQNPLLRATSEAFVRELAYSERRSAAAQAASAKALSRVQAKSVSMLADLRDMQDRHSGEVFGDLLRLDHSTSQLGLMTDRLALLMGGRSSRVWNKPIGVESILRGAVGRIAAYRRVRLHSSSRAAISGFAAEGVMHLLAELLDNAANFSPPIDEVHVYVEERSAGLVVTIEDSGLKMSDAAMRRAAESVSGRHTDLASLQGTRLGLSVVGRLAVKYGISVNYRPSSRGGTGVVVLLPPQLVSQQRVAVPEQGRVAPATAPADPAPVTAPPAPQPLLPGARTPEPRDPGVPADGEPAAVGSGEATPLGLPVRAPGRTMAEAEQGRRRPAPEPAPGAPDAVGGPDTPRAPRPVRDAGASFGAFHRGRTLGGASRAPGRDDTPGDPGDAS